MTAFNIMKANVTTFNFISKVKEVYRMLENTDFSAFPVMNNQGRPVGLIERDAMIAMIENKCWYYRESRMSGNFGTKKGEEIVGEVVDEHSAHLGVKKAEKDNRKHTKENKDEFDNSQVKKQTGSINDDSLFDPNKREDNLSFENNPQQL